MPPPGSAIGMISSTAGLGWEAELPLLREYLDTPDFDSAAAWIDAHPGTATYRWSKQAMNACVARRALPLLQHGIRITGTYPRATPYVGMLMGRMGEFVLGPEASAPAGH